MPLDWKNSKFIGGRALSTRTQVPCAASDTPDGTGRAVVADSWIRVNANRLHRQATCLHGPQIACRVSWAKPEVIHGWGSEWSLKPDRQFFRRLLRVL